MAKCGFCSKHEHLLELIWRELSFQSSALNYFFLYHQYKDREDDHGKHWLELARGILSSPERKLLAQYFGEDLCSQSTEKAT